MKNILSPSLLAADFTKLGQQLEQIEKGGAQYIHLDVMDGLFVPNISFGIPVIQSIRKCSKLVFDVHLMIVEPERYVEAFYKAGADILNFHVEATKCPGDVLAKIKSFGLKAGITIKDNTLFIKDYHSLSSFSVENSRNTKEFEKLLQEYRNTEYDLEIALPQKQYQEIYFKTVSGMQ